MSRSRLVAPALALTALAGGALYFNRGIPKSQQIKGAPAPIGRETGGTSLNPTTGAGQGSGFSEGLQGLTGHGGQKAGQWYDHDPKDTRVASGLSTSPTKKLPPQEGKHDAKQAGLRPGDQRDGSQGSSEGNKKSS